MISERVSRLAFSGSLLLLFGTSTAVTVAWCMSMSDMGAVPMPGGWSMSMAWMPMCGQTWTGAAAAFTGMWLVMMVAMMLPVLVPMLRRYRRAVGRTGEMHPDLLRSEEHTSELQSLMRISYAVFCLKKKKNDEIV